MLHVIAAPLEQPRDRVDGLYCRDQWQGLSRAGGSVFEYAGLFYTLAHLESIGFYDRLAALAETSPESYCELWRGSR